MPTIVNDLFYNPILEHTSGREPKIVAVEDIELFFWLHVTYSDISNGVCVFVEGVGDVWGFRMVE